MIGGSVFGVTDIHAKLTAFKKSLGNHSGRYLQPTTLHPRSVCSPTVRRLYMAKVDIRKAFDTINQQKLLDILRHVLNEVSGHLAAASVSLLATRRIHRKST